KAERCAFHIEHPDDLEVHDPRALDRATGAASPAEGLPKLDRLAGRVDPFPEEVRGGHGPDDGHLGVHPDVVVRAEVAIREAPVADLRIAGGDAGDLAVPVLASGRHLPAS